MSLPRLTLATQESSEIARVLRGVLRLRTVIVPLKSPPPKDGQYLLDIEVPGFGLVTVLAEPSGGQRPDGTSLTLRPVTRAQMAELFALVERLDEPAPSVPSEPPPPDPEPEDSWDNDADGDTFVEDAPSRMIGVPLGPPPMIADTIPPSVAFGRSHVRSTAPPSSLKPFPMPSPVRDSHVGRVLAGKYRIEAPIGRGAAAVVYRATHTELRREVAIKILHAANQGEAQFVRRFKAEALTASKLEHINVTRVIDFGQEAGELYLVMEFINGRPLEAILSSEGPLQSKRVVDIGIQACRALAFAHDKGVIHRDIKPENIMILPDHDDDGEPCDLVKVCDFGLAKLRDPDADTADITASGMLCGSPAYMSPEQARGDTLDFRTDLYSLGVTLFEALTGSLPHDAHTLNELLLKKCMEAPPLPSSLVPSIDPLLDDVLLRAMATDPRTRHASAQELRTELRTIRSQLVDDEQGDHRTIIGG